MLRILTWLLRLKTSKRSGQPIKSFSLALKPLPRKLLKISSHRFAGNELSVGNVKPKEKHFAESITCSLECGPTALLSRYFGDSGGDQGLLLGADGPSSSSVTPRPFHSPFCSIRWFWQSEKLSGMPLGPGRGNVVILPRGSARGSIFVPLHN